MSVKTTQTYTCDGCGKKQGKASDLRRFTLTESKIVSREEVASAKTDLCAECEHKLHDAALPLFPADEREHLYGIVR